MVEITLCRCTNCSGNPCFTIIVNYNDRVKPKRCLLHFWRTARWVQLSTFDALITDLQRYDEFEDMWVGGAVNPHLTQHAIASPTPAAPPAKKRGRPKKVKKEPVPPGQKSNRFEDLDIE